jgi:hypothetical protein
MLQPPLSLTKPNPVRVSQNECMEMDVSQRKKIGVSVTISQSDTSHLELRVN